MGLKTVTPVIFHQSINKFAHTRKQQICPHRDINRHCEHRHRMWESSFPALRPVSHWQQNNIPKKEKKTAISWHVEGGFLFTLSHVNMWASLCWSFQNRMYFMNHIFIIFHFMNHIWGRYKVVTLLSAFCIWCMNAECIFMTCVGYCSSYVPHCTVLFTATVCKF